MDVDDFGERGFCPTSCFFFGAAGFAFAPFVLSAGAAFFFPAAFESLFAFGAAAFFAAAAGFAFLVSDFDFGAALGFTEVFVAAVDFFAGAALAVFFATGFFAGAAFLVAGAAFDFLAAGALVVSFFFVFAGAARPDLAAPAARRAGEPAVFAFAGFKAAFSTVFVAIIPLS